MPPSDRARGLSLRARRAGKRFLASAPVNPVVTFALREVLPESFQWRFARYVPKAGTIRCPLPNGRTLLLRSNGDDRVLDRVFWRGWNGYEPELANALYERASRARTFLDVGAHVGLYSLVVALANPRARVFAFEPLPATHARLLRHVELNGATNVVPVPEAVGDSVGWADVWFDPADGVPGEATLDAEAGRHHAEKVGHRRASVRVPVTTIDEFVAGREVGDVDLMKIDTESFEGPVLRGAASTLARCRPVIFCEVLEQHRTAAEIEAALSPLGYRYLQLTREGPVVHGSIEPDISAPNWMFEPG